MMPKVSGLELVQAVKGDPDLAATPIILLSAKAQSADLKSGLDAGADDYVTKPFEPLDLVDRVNALLGARCAMPGPISPASFAAGVLLLLAAATAAPSPSIDRKSSV